MQISHRSIAAFFRAVHPLLEADGDARCLNTSPLHFDVSVVDLLYPLSRGATVHLSPALPLPPLLLGTLERERITHMAAVGSTLRLLAESSDGFRTRDISALRRLMTGAEVIDPRAVQQWLAAAPELTVVNGYGPTEATCLVLAERIDRREPGRTAHYPIGTPLPGVTLRFLATDGSADATGPGEIAVSGEQVMLGYLGRAEEEARVLTWIDGVRFYRTGDLGELRPDGSVEFHGRRDDEIKHRGYRVNLQEVKQALEQHPQVARAFAVQVVDAAGRGLIACALLPSDAPAEPVGSGWHLSAGDPEQITGIHHHLRELLPPYMVPGELRVLSALPVLSSGKPDTAGIARALRTACASPSGGPR
ncbi:amino acid adenylation domain-containing protein [Streptacidiphilus sp. 4-A2]|nr:amino acid adenylation domain-containing protein [Streptacidiphilus sp. 4-A2]